MRILKLTIAINLGLGLLFGLSLLVTRPTVQATAAATLQSLIDAAPAGGTVVLPASTFNESVTVNKTLTLTGVSSSTTIIQAVTSLRAITVITGNDLRLENLTVTGGQTNDVGGGIYLVNGSLALINCRIISNSAAYGAVYSNRARLSAWM